MSIWKPPIQRKSARRAVKSPVLVAEGGAGCADDTQLCLTKTCSHMGPGAPSKKD